MAVIFVMVIGVAGTYYLLASHAASWSGGLEVGGTTSGYCMSATTTVATGGYLKLAPCDNTLVQKWELVSAGTYNNQATYIIRNYTANTSECVDDWQQSKALGVSNYTRLYTCNTGDIAQRFYWTGSSTRQLKNVVSGLCIDALGYKITSGTALDMYTCKTSGTGNQQWFEVANSASNPTTGGSSTTAGGGGGNTSNASMVLTSNVDGKGSDILIFTKTGAVTNTNILGLFPVWGNNGADIYYVDPGQASVHEITPNGTNVRAFGALPSGAEKITSLNLSETAKKVAYTVQIPQQGTQATTSTLYTTDLAGGGLLNINAKTGISNITAAYFSPDGTKLLVQGFVPAPNQVDNPILEIVNSDGSGTPYPVSFGTGVSITGDPWSSDGQNVVYRQSLVTAQGWGLYEANAVAGTNTVQRTLLTQVVSPAPNGPASIYGVSWSPTQNEVAYGETLGTNSYLKVINVSTKAITTSAPIAGSDDLLPVDWSPDGTNVSGISQIPGSLNGALYIFNEPNALSAFKVPTVLTLSTSPAPTLDWKQQ